MKGNLGDNFLQIKLFFSECIVIHDITLSSAKQKNV